MLASKLHYDGVVVIKRNHLTLIIYPFSVFMETATGMGPVVKVWKLPNIYI